jgi:pantoate--beta-alanine ligase
MREPDGLAMSSRNRFLDASERAIAPLLYQVMRDAAGAMAGGAPVPGALAAGRERLVAAGFAPDYLALVEAEGLEPLDALDRARPLRLLAAARLGGVRLLDNMAVLA